MAPERRGLRRGGESQAAASLGPRPRSGPAPPPCPEASTAAGSRGGGELCRRRRRLWDSASRRFGGSWVARARTARAGAEPASGPRRTTRRLEAESWSVPGVRACVASASAAAAGSLRGVPVRPRGDSLPAGTGHPMRSPGGGPTGTGTVPTSRAPTPAPGLGLTRAYSARAVPSVQAPRAVDL